ncbi:MAG: hypothetical protein F6J97_12220 [Leptolyngbya sp. SIO4C1]|nr:hypothetical protein [Leptolyngbya sp. SIO4C1]
MNTPSHIILNLAILGRRSQPQWNPHIALGAFIPDAAMFVFYGWTRVIRDLPERQIWGTLYYDPTWQTIFDLWNSIPLALLGVATGLWLRRRRQTQMLGSAIALCCASIILHCLEDLPTHREDAHRHFWPLSNFRFESPISYWDPNHYGDIFAPIELAIVLLSSLYVFRLVRSRWGRGLLIAVNIFLCLGYLGFYF